GGALVVNVDEPEVAATFRAGWPQLIAVATDAGHPFLASHRPEGGTIAFLDGGEAVLARGYEEVMRAPLESINADRSVNSETDPFDVLLAWTAAWAANRHSTVAH